MKIILRIIAYPFVLGTILIAYIFHAFRNSLLFLRYGGEWITYKEGDSKKHTTDLRGVNITKKAAMKPGQYRKAKRKFIRKRVHSFRLTKISSYGRNDKMEFFNDRDEVKTTWNGDSKAEWQRDLYNEGDFVGCFIWGQTISRIQPEFRFTYILKKDFKY